MILNTKIEINKMISKGVELIPLSEMESLLESIGLKLDLNTNNYAHYYYNDLNASGSFYQLTTQPLDKRALSAYNIGSDFYQAHSGDSFTNESIQLKNLRNNFFCLKEYKGIYYIVSF